MTFHQVSREARTAMVVAVVWFCAMAGSALAVDTVWNFDGDLTAGAGTSTMAYRGDTGLDTLFGTTAALGLPALYGDDGSAAVMAFPAAAPSQGYTVTHNAPPTPGSSYVEQYTMIWDLLYPSTSDIAWRGLLQTNESNSNDGDLFVKDVPWGGIGIEGTYHGAILPDQWNRVAITRDAAGTMAKYINGGYVGEQDISSSRFALDPTYHLLTDENFETQPGYVSSYRFVDQALTQPEIFQLGGVHAAGTDAAGQVFPEASDFAPGSFTIAVLGDTQSYVNRGGTYAAVYDQMTQWLVDNKSARNIQYVLHVGDIVDADDTGQWDRAVNAMSTLDAEIPYALAPGNHDYGGDRSVSQFNQLNRFGPGSAYAQQPTLGGYYPGEPASRMNTYHTFEAGGEGFLVVALEFGPRDEVVAWAETVVDAHPDHRAILLTHAYMFDGGMWFDASLDPNDPQGRTHDQVRDELVNHVESIYNPHSYGFAGANANDGKELWDKLVNDRANFSLVMTGHQFDERDGFPYLQTLGEAGNDVYQMLFDTQTRAFGGEGWIRLLEFDPDGRTVRIKTYSPLLEQWSYASDELLAIEMSGIGLLPGDMNGDGEVNHLDVAPFVDVLLNGPYLAAADMNQDALLNGQDVRAFVEAAAGAGAAPVAEPTTALLCLLGLAGWATAYGRRTLI